MIATRESQRGFLLLVLIALLATGACQTAQDSSTDATASPVPDMTEATAAATQVPRPMAELNGVGIDLWHPWYEAEAGLIDSQVAQFNQENEWGITVRSKGHTGFTELYNDVTEALPSDAAPELVIALPEQILAWDSSGSVMDLSSYIANPAYGFHDDAVKDFPDVFWNQDIVEGRQLGVPAVRTAYLIAYNESWAEELGFEAPPTTPEEFQAQACAAHAAMSRDDDPANDGRGGWHIRTDAMTFLSWLTAFNGGIVDGAGYRFLSPRNLEATVYIKQLYDDGCAWTSTTEADEGLSFALRQALFATAPVEELTSYGRAMALAENTDDWTVMSFPGTQISGPLVYGASYTVIKNSAEQQLAAWLFIRWMLEPERQHQWVEVTGLLPVRNSVQDGLASYSRSHPQWATAVELAQQGQGLPQLASWRQVRTMMADGFDAMFRANTPAGRVAEILAIMDRTARDIMQ